MDNLKKNLADQNKDRADLKNALETLYIECGAAQFEYAAHKIDGESRVDPAALDAWKALRDGRIQDADTILNIKTAQSRQSELTVFYGEVDKLSREQQNNYEKARKKFILTFFRTYNEDQSLLCLDTIRQALEPLKADYEAALEEQKTLEQKKNDSRFLKKLALGTQLMSLKSKITGLQKKLDDKIMAVGDGIFTDSKIEELHTDLTFPETLELVYMELTSIIVKRTEMENRKRTLTDEQKKLQELLIEYGVSDTPQKRINSLTNQIKDADEKIIEAEKRQGLIYADRFYTSEGADTDQTAIDSEPELFKPYLAAIKENRIKLEKNTYNIEYIKNEMALAEEVRKIAALHKAIAGYKDGISQYERLIETAEQDIIRAEDIKTTLEEKNNELLPKFTSV